MSHDLEIVGLTLLIAPSIAFWICMAYFIWEVWIRPRTPGEKERDAIYDKKRQAFLNCKRQKKDGGKA